MKSIHSILLLTLSLLLCACGIQVQLQTVEPSKVNLRMGTSLRVAPVYRNYAVDRLQDALYAQLATTDFYALGGNEAILYIERAHIDQERYINHTCDDKHRHDKHHHHHHCDCVETVKTTLTATVQLELHGRIIYRRTLSDTSYSDYADFDDVARDIVKDLVPRTVSYSVSIHPQDGNIVLENAAKACKHGDWQGGQSLAQSSLNTFPNDPEAYYLLGMVERYNRNFRASDDYFRKAASIKPSSRYSSAIRDNATISAKEQLARQQLNME